MVFKSGFQLYCEENVEVSPYQLSINWVEMSINNKRYYIDLAKMINMGIIENQ